MTSWDKLRLAILDKAVVKGRVILSSGKEAEYYVDLRRVTLDSSAAPLVGEVMLELTKDLDFEAVGGLTLGADPVATAMMHVAARNGRKIDAFVVRKAEKAHGLQRRIEGPDIKESSCSWKSYPLFGQRSGVLRRPSKSNARFKRCTASWRSHA